VPPALPPPSSAPGFRRSGRSLSWAPFLAGLLGLAGLVTVLTLQLIAHERAQRRETALRHVESLARLASARVAQVLDQAAQRVPGSARYPRARLMQADDGRWQVQLPVEGLSGFLCARHSMTVRSMYATQKDAAGGVAGDPR